MKIKDQRDLLKKENIERFKKETESSGIKTLSSLLKSLSHRQVTEKTTELVTETSERVCRQNCRDEYNRIKIEFLKGDVS